MQVLKQVGIAIFGAVILTVAASLAAGKASPAYADPGHYRPQLPAYCVQYQYQLQWQLQSTPGRWQFFAGYWHFVPGFAHWVQVPVPICVRYAYIINRFPTFYPQFCSGYIQPWMNPLNCYQNQYPGMGPISTYY